MHAWLWVPIVALLAAALPLLGQPAAMPGVPGQQAPGISGQPIVPGARQRDPLMTLMLAQPRLDVDSPVRVDAAFDPPQTRPGQPVVYRLSLNALKDAVAWSGRLPEVRGLPFRAGASGETMQIVGTNMQPRTAFNFHCVPQRPGMYIVPEFTIRAYGVDVKVPSAVLHVSSSVAGVRAQKLLLEVSPKRPFVGQAAQVRILSPSPSGMVQALAQVQLNGHGFMQEVTANRQAVETELLDGRPVPHFVYETVLTPILPGRAEITAQAFAVGNRFSGSVVITGPATITGAAAQYTLVDSDPVRLDFRPLPAIGRPPGFAGAVGDYLVDVPQLSTNVVRLGEPVKLKVTIHGRGNLGRLSMPPPPSHSDWQIFEPKPEQLPPQVLLAKGSIVFTYTLVPLNDAVRATPELPFSYFQPDQEKYVSRNIRPVPVRVVAAPGEKPADLARLLRQRVRNGTAADKPSLGSVATTPGVTSATLTPLQLRPWFPLVQAAPALLFGGLLLWERRRRYLQAHTGILLRRHALRALRRYRARMRNQSRWGNDPGFAEAAVAALRVITAPHYGAAPGAITRHEVLAIMRADAPSSAQQTITSLFDFTNARRFSNAETKTSGEMLPLLEDVEIVLDYLKQQSDLLLPRPAARRPPRPSKAAIPLCLLAAALPLGTLRAAENGAKAYFDGGMTAYWAGEYGFAAELFRDAARIQPSAGALRNLGNSEWHRGNTGRAILAWEQALWLDPFDGISRGNLVYARRAAQLDAPTLDWHEAASSYLPSTWWAWLAGVSLWLAVGAVVLPAVLRLRRSTWHQAVAAIGLAGFLITLPAHIGIMTRSRLGFALERETPLRLTPTAQAQAVTTVAAGEPLRLERRRGDYILVRTSRTRGWVEARAFGALCPEAAGTDKAAATVRVHAARQAGE